jgi:hypothetical protein
MGQKKKKERKKKTSQKQNRFGHAAEATDIERSDGEFGAHIGATQHVANDVAGELRIVLDKRVNHSVRH